MYSTYLRNYDQRKHESDKERYVQYEKTQTSRDKKYGTSEEKYTAWH